MAAHGQLDRISNRFAAGQRATHALMAHGDPVGDGDGGKFTRSAQRLLDPHLGRLRLTIERNVTGRCFVPTGGNADQWLMNFFFGHAHRVIIGPMRRACRAFGYMATWQFGFVELAHWETFPVGFAWSYKSPSAETSLI